MVHNSSLEGLTFWRERQISKQPVYDGGTAGAPREPGRGVEGPEKVS